MCGVLLLPVLGGVLEVLRVQVTVQVHIEFSSFITQKPADPPQIGRELLLLPLPLPQPTEIHGSMRKQSSQHTHAQQSRRRRLALQPVQQ
jgi:hypothetical protein